MNLFFFFLLLLSCPYCFASSPTYGDELGSFRIELEEGLYPAIAELMKRGDEFVPLGEIPYEIEEYFLSKKCISEPFHDEIVQLVDDKLTGLLIEQDISESLIFILKFICATSKQKLLDSRRPLVRTNRRAVGVLADICHLLKAPLQRLILTSKAYGYGEMFKDALVLLESIRRIFLEKTDVVLFFDFNEKLNFIRISIDYYFSNCKSNLLQNSLGIAIYESLTSEIMTQIDGIIEEIKAETQQLRKYSTGLGANPIDSSLSVLDSERSTTNEDLWTLIVGKVNDTRGIVESSFPDLFANEELSVLDVINENLMRHSHDLVPFNIEMARASVKNSAAMYFTSMKETLRPQMEPEAYQVIKDRIDTLGNILMEALKRFDAQLSAKVHQIVFKLGLTCEESRKVDFTVVAVSELAKEKASLVELEAYL